MKLDWSSCPAVESVPGKVSGAWVFRGTRMPVAAVFENLEDGLTIDQIVELYDGLTREQVQAVLDFAAQSLEVHRAADNAHSLRPGNTSPNPAGSGESHRQNGKAARVEYIIERRSHSRRGEGRLRRFAYD